ncbi:calcium-binding protein [Sinorhizobium sp. RAC02]|uniref:calcium-binding protein n=1 Tax=Sinorhizobium sp. RAC02 TaxID=1842534 RepID=UPI00083D92B8|nr:calcium-binding protein [Sinorhizobium sp. RAC02]AOF88954.1 hemolysin-type calcium-binding repeat family protein [Sinorhizobium sp. RAC02]
MATVTYTKFATEYFWDILSEWHDYKLAVSSDKKTVTFTFSDTEAGWTKKLVLTGTGLTIGDGLITGGTISGVSARNELGQEIYKVAGLAIRGYAFRADNLYEAKGLLLAGNDAITGTAKGDDIETGAGNDKVTAGAGDDYIKDFMGADTYDGGADWDEVDYSEGARQHGWLPSKGISVNMVTGKVVDAFGFTDTLKNVEGIYGTNYVDKFVGSNGDNEFAGLAGNDIIDGGGGDFDGVMYQRDYDQGGKGKVLVDLVKGYAIDGFGDRDTLKNIEEVSGGRSNDTIIGNTKNNNLRGGDGNDVIRGGGGVQDRLEGQVGNDTLYGTKGTKDFFVFRDRSDRNLGTDTVNAFTDGEDKIHFRNFSKIDSLSDLKITQSGDDVLITFSHGKIIVDNITVSKFTAADFLFE